MGTTRIRFRVTTWNNRCVMLPKGKVILLHHLVGPYYVARIGYGSLLKLDYCIFFERSPGRRGSITVYNLLKKSYAGSAVRSKAPSMKRGILSALTRGASLRILLRQLPKTGAINLPLHRYDYLLMAVSLIGPKRKTIDINARSHPE